MFEELDYRPTPIGPLTLRRRRAVGSDEIVYEIKLGEEFLMSSQFTASEVALARLGLAACAGDVLDVVVGGLGLGYTAQAVLRHRSLRELVVVEYLEGVIDWHQRGLLPLGAEITSDAKCRLIHGDFFELARNRAGFDPGQPGRRFDAILLDIDHSPEALLSERSRTFYQLEGLRAVSEHLKPGGVFGLWSNDGPDAAITARLSEAFGEARAEPVSFYNSLQSRECTQTVYLARALREV